MRSSGRAAPASAEKSSKPHGLEAMAARLADRQPLQIGKLERTIGLIRDLPGFTVTDVSLVPTADRAIHMLKLVVGRDRVRQLFFTDNRGPAESDRVRLYSSTALSSLIMAGDELRLDLSAIPTERYRFLYGQIGAGMPIGQDGLRLGMFASAGDLGQRDDDRRIDGTSTNFSVQLGYPILRRQSVKLVAKGVINDLRNTTDEDGVHPARPAAGGADRPGLLDRGQDPPDR